MEWLQLPIVSLAVIEFVFTIQQHARQQEIESRRTKVEREIEEQLEKERDANRENRRLLAAALERIPPLVEAPTEKPPGAPQTIAGERRERIRPGHRRRRRAHSTCPGVGCWGGVRGLDRTVRGAPSQERGFGHVLLQTYLGEIYSLDLYEIPRPSDPTSCVGATTCCLRSRSRIGT